MLIRLLTAAAALAVAVSVCAQQSDDDTGLLAVGEKAPAVKLKTHDGKDFDLRKTIETSKAKATLVNFWFVH